jgi:hypothetical protein
MITERDFELLAARLANPPQPKAIRTSKPASKTKEKPK